MCFCDINRIFIITTKKKLSSARVKGPHIKRDGELALNSFFIPPSPSLFNFQGLGDKQIYGGGFHLPGSLHRQHKSALLLIRAVGGLAAFGNRMNSPLVSEVFTILRHEQDQCERKGKYKFPGNSSIHTFRKHLLKPCCVPATVLKAAETNLS